MKKQIQAWKSCTQDKLTDTSLIIASHCMGGYFDFISLFSTFIYKTIRFRKIYLF